jgi:hypothetical protein
VADGAKNRCDLQWRRTRRNEHRRVAAKPPVAALAAFVSPFTAKPMVAGEQTFSRSAASSDPDPRGSSAPLP